MKMSDDRQVCECESEEEAGPGVHITGNHTTDTWGRHEARGVDEGRAGLRGSPCGREHLLVKVVPRS